ncbi:manganese efflux pump MntP family protein [Clostridium aciditolerans]|uniref:Manganese efflux pump n=1 Tax=Clostridium aciditolerans TaxID=339861 RepID=A0A934I1Z7_9CLOT|nr:manganese efflux pump [Clostridium aciditolerans]MBI6875362.1 manganese efflux pump [Clostridium aciditolerans]
MSIFVIFLAALGLSIDGFTLSFTGGILTKKQKLKSAFYIGIYFCVVQTTVAALGWFLGSKFKGYIAEYSSLFAIGLLLFIGVRMIFQYIKERKEANYESKELDHKFFPILALLVSFDELAAGVSFGLFQVNIVEVLVILAITFFITAFTGILIGRKLGLILKEKADLIGGLMFIAIALVDIFA